MSARSTGQFYGKINAVFKKKTNQITNQQNKLKLCTLLFS